MARSSSELSISSPAITPVIAKSSRWDATISVWVSQRDNLASGIDAISRDLLTLVNELAGPP
jgi:hypothetical protein